MSMEKLKKLIRRPLGEVPRRREGLFIEGASLLFALKGVRSFEDVRGSLRAKLRLMKDLRRSPL
ncbi:MAG: hypothetical protein Q9N26_07830 [Aquificota bacterium]|nr:hypothetical protein [Aquificota bacterium]